MGKRVTLEQVRPDMVLATEVVDGAGRLLLPTGTTITDKHIRYCQMWGILELLERWRLPGMLVEAAASHHSPSLFRQVEMQFVHAVNAIMVSDH